MRHGNVTKVSPEDPV